MKFLIPFLLALSLHAADADEARLRALDAELVVATYSNDAAWFEKNLTDDYVLTTSSGKMVTKADLVKQVKSGYAMEAYKPSEVVVKIYGDAAVITGRINQRFVAGDQKIDADLRYTDLWIKRDGVWRNAIGHASPIAIKREAK